MNYGENMHGLNISPNTKYNNFCVQENNPIKSNILQEATN